MLLLDSVMLKAQNSEPSLTAEQVIDTYKPSLVSIWMRDENYYDYAANSYKDTIMLSGSGFIVSEGGLVCTNFHVIEQIDSLIVKTSDGVFHSGELLYADEEIDFAMLRIISDRRLFETVKIGNSSEVKAGQEVYAIGSPLGFEYTISSGIVAAVRENEKVSFQDPYTYLTEEKTFPKVIQVTAAISPGNSGGALFNRRGEVIGITTYTYVGYGNLNFATAINTYKDVINMVMTASPESDEYLMARKEEGLFRSMYKIGSALKTQLSYDWVFSKHKDTMTVPDSFAVRQDSINRTRFGKCENAYFRCIELRPDSFYVYQDLLDLYVLTENFEKAEGFYRTIAGRFDSDSLLNLLSSNLASAYSTSKDYDKAILFYRKMLAEDPSLNAIRYQIANAYHLKNENTKAVAEYKSLLKANPQYTDAYVQLGKIYYEVFKDYEKAGKYLEKAYELQLEGDSYSNDNSALYFYRGMIAVEEGNESQAILSYMELKSSYDYSVETIQRKKKLYNAVRSLND